MIHDTRRGIKIAIKIELIISSQRYLTSHLHHVWEGVNATFLLRTWPYDWRLYKLNSCIDPATSENVGTLSGISASHIYDPDRPADVPFRPHVHWVPWTCPNWFFSNTLYRKCLNVILKLKSKRPREWTHVSVVSNSLYNLSLIDIRSFLTFFKFIQIPQFYETDSASFGLGLGRFPYHSCETVKNDNYFKGTSVSLFHYPRVYNSCYCHRDRGCEYTASNCWRMTRRCLHSDRCQSELSYKWNSTLERLAAMIGELEDDYPTLLSTSTAPSNLLATSQLLFSPVPTSLWSTLLDCTISSRSHSVAFGSWGAWTVSAYNPKIRQKKCLGFWTERRARSLGNFEFGL